MTDPEERRSIIRGQTSRSITIEHVPRAFRMYSLSEEEVRRFRNGYLSMHQTFLGIAIGALLSIAIALATVRDLDAGVHAVFVALLGLAVLGILFFGWQAWAERREFAGQADQILRDR